MKNPLKPIGDKLKELRDKLAAGRKRESAKMVVDGVGDSGIIGGIALLGTAAFMPAAPATMLIAGTVFIVAGGAAKIAAWKMKPDPYDVTKPQQALPKDTDSGTSAPKLAKGLARDFANANDNARKAPAAKVAANPGIAPNP